MNRKSKVQTTLITAATKRLGSQASNDSVDKKRKNTVKNQPISGKNIFAKYASVILRKI